ncbi:MAG: hypothetical protein HON43_04025 [Alphaproteobacteria bacterium]|nr:hypothetical protein [Alphaproteobacteria bacterium]MBT5389846.1 hypothetical protein [Alphaproteobacteria bacterium]MBT5540972.1 hypothetical protein [Alphaproteobacteria bacterium]
MSKRLWNKYFLLGWLVAFLIPCLSEAAFPKAPQPTKASLISSITAISNQNEVQMGLVLETQSPWKIYAHSQNGHVGFPPKINWNHSNNIKDVEIYWPQPKEVESYGETISIYEGKIILPLKVTLKNPGQHLTMNMHLNYMSCSDMCVPVEQTVTFFVPNGPSSQTDDAKLIEAAYSTSTSDHTLNWSLFFMILGFALLGGFILNFMPCVLPVLSLKILSVLKSHNHSAARIRLRFMITVAGILSFFIAFAVSINIAKTFGVTMGWGFQFQNPIFLTILFIALVVFGLGTWGTINIPIPSQVSRWLPTNETHPYLSDYVKGILAAVLATPCTAPFLGTAVGFALGRSPLELLVIFFTIGLGLAIPYILVAMSPKMVHLLPKPGPWMEKLKKILAVGLFGTALWIGSLLGQHVYEKHISIESASSLPWTNFDSEKIPSLVRDGKTVLVTISATWCLTCKFNENFVFNSEEVSAALKNPDIVLMKGDWSKKDERIKKFLMLYQRGGIPFTVIFSPQRPEGVILPELLSTDILLESLTQAQSV